jgi:tRNA threonylcarbamoyladenosine modification (KEOPS) complex Cgi121 subunit
MPIQFFDAKKVAGSQHLFFAALNTLKAFKKQINISNNLAVESLIYASAQRQIEKAVKMLGITENSSEIAVLIIAKNGNEKKNLVNFVNETIPGKREDDVLKLTPEKISLIKNLFNISDLEFKTQLKSQGLEKETLTDLIIERMALLVIKS